MFSFNNLLNETSSIGREQRSRVVGIVASGALAARVRIAPSASDQQRPGHWNTHIYTCVGATQPINHWFDTYSTRLARRYLVIGKILGLSARMDQVCAAIRMCGGRKG